MSSSIDMLQVEKQRQALEESIAKLRQSLKHWHMWEAEYEGLKEEIESIPDDLPESSLLEISRTYGGDLVNEKEILDLTGLNQGLPRTSHQILDLILHRQEYVQKNIETLQRQYFAAEGKVEEFAFASVWKNVEPGGLPLTEIHEELDEDDNVISSNLSQPESAQASLVQSLRNAGLEDKELKDVTHGNSGANVASIASLPASSSPGRPGSPVSALKQSSVDSNAQTTAAANDEQHGTRKRPSIRKKSVSFTADTKSPLETVQPDEKKVAFAPKVAVMPAAEPPDVRSVSFSPQIEEIPPIPLVPVSPDVRAGAEAMPDLQAALRASFEPGEKVLVEDENEEASSHVVVPENESEEDARIRREMLDYHLNEVGSVVAQVDLDEAMAEAEGEDDRHSASDFTSSEYMDDEDTPYTSGMSDEEESDDELGRSKTSQISPQYRERMLELERRLIENLGPAPRNEVIQNVDPGLDPQDVRRLVIRDKRTSFSSISSENSEKRSSQKKRVSFADGLDIAEHGDAPPPIKARKMEETELEGPVTETVMERSNQSPTTQQPEIAGSKSSRFKASRTASVTSTHADGSVDEPMIDDTDSPQGPTGRTLADALVERPSTSNNAPPSVDEPDPILQRRELAAEYYRKRNELVKQQGGFATPDDDGQGDLMEERDGKVKKVSRFRAARLNG